MASGPRTVRTIKGTPLTGRRELGALLRQRRIELGYLHRPAFVLKRLPMTPDGNPNTRLVADIEEAYRDNFPESRLRQLARAYLVTYESLIAVAHRRASALVPVGAADPAAPPVPLPPPSPFDAPRTDADRPFFDPINERRVELATRGIAYPTGAQMFGEGTDDAREWDATFAPLPVGDKVWAVADLRRRAAARKANPPASSTGT